MVLGQNSSFTYHNGLNAVVSTLPIRNGNGFGLLPGISGLLSWVSTLPIRNGNDTRAILTSLFQEM